MILQVVPMGFQLRSISSSGEDNWSLVDKTIPLSVVRLVPKLPDKLCELRYTNNLF